MNYRQWKKKYKKEHGYNPPITADRRKQVKIIKRIDFDKVMELMAQSFRIFTEECGKLIANIGKLLKEAADTIEKKTEDEGK